MDKPSGFGGGLGRDAYVRKPSTNRKKNNNNNNDKKTTRKRPRPSYNTKNNKNNSKTKKKTSLLKYNQSLASPSHPPYQVVNKPPTPPTKAEVQKELFLQNERRAGQEFNHANLQHTVGKGASLFFSMFEQTVQKATLDIDRKIVIKEEVKTGLFRLDKIETIQPKPKRQRSLPQNKGTHTLFLNRALSGVQPPKQLTPRTKSKCK